ncbi:OmpA family protein [Flammeovirga sp. MY04]|uniref:OmpA family protein n=1 Tax=Flammeovirga sp. MY04 TaxID=1191459 RepID=UPI0008063DB6|nr:OmpA family protein [Flammeovirga sp. MY04]ANQ49351.1 OmpA family protein [Flammeovirga sp. MY04]
MKNFILLLLMLISPVLFAQTMKNQRVQDFDERNEERFQNMDYAKALKHYQKKYQKESNPEKKEEYAIQMARCFQKLNKPQKAVDLFDKMDSSLIASNEVATITYADALYNVGEYKKAEQWYKKAFARKGAEHSAEVYQKLKNLSAIQPLMRDQDLFEVRSPSFNSNQDDFSPFKYNNGYVFSSNRKTKQTGGKKYAWDGGSFLDLFYVDSLGNVQNFSSKINSKYHEASASISPDGNMIAFTRSSAKEKTEDKESNLQLMIATKNGEGDWSKPQDFLWNMTDYSTGHPAFSSDGKRLYFVSDRPDGIGGSDIYYSDIKENGKFSSPTLMGKEINTEKNEVFPAIDGNKLYFSSDGWGGLGGLDIVMQNLDSLYEKPVHLHAPINSSYDDFGGTKINLKSYYISSNRMTEFSDKGNDNILEVEKVFFKGIVIDKFERTPIPDALVEIDGKVVTKSDESGLFKVRFDQWPDLMPIIGRKQSYASDTLEGEEAAQTIEMGEPIVLELAQPYIEGHVYDSLTKEPIIARLTIKDRSTETERVVFSDSTGYYRISAKAQEHYDFISERPRYFTRRQATNTQDHYKTVRDIAMNPIVGQRIRIYYNFDMSNIRDDASHSLDTVVNVMKYNPTITIELSSHTDIRGRDAYNQTLSDRRAKEAFDYAVRKGIAAERMTYKGYGETMPVIDCKGKRCTEAEHQLNRRTEFYVTGYLNEKGYFGSDYNKFYPDSLSEVLEDSDKEIMRSNFNSITGIFVSLIGGVEGYNVKALDDQGKLLAQDKTTEEGVFNLMVPNQYKYKLVLDKEGIEITHRYITLEDFDGKSNFDVTIYK